MSDEVLFIGTNNNSYRFTHLVTMGLVPTWKTTSQVVAGDLVGKSLVVVDNSISSSNLQSFTINELLGWSGGVIMNEAALLDELNMSAGTSFPSQVGDPEFTLLRSHPITDAFGFTGIGDYRFHNNSQTSRGIPVADAGNSANWLMSQPGAQNIGEATSIFMSFYEPGDSLPGGGTAAGRRLLFPLQGSGTGGEILNLYKVCVNWTRGTI
ncbi:MAG: hypothetical protein AAF810_05410 [Cyanobacteria bacterium P01_D01_bin.36]